MQGISQLSLVGFFRDDSGHSEDNPVAFGYDSITENISFFRSANRRIMYGK